MDVSDYVEMLISSGRLYYELIESGENFYVVWRFIDAVH